MTLDASGNLGIGTTSPAGKLDVRAGTGSTILVAADATNLVSINNTNATSGFQNLKFAGATLQFFTGTAGGGSAAEGGRFDSSGNLLVGTTSMSGGNAKVYAQNANTDWSYASNQTGSGTFYHMVFRVSGTSVGQITSSSTTTTYATSSDYRLKENIEPMSGALAAVAQLKPCTYTWKADGSNGQGFIAHELQAVVPDAVVGEKDAVDGDGKIKPQGIDTSFLVATLTAALQEAHGLIKSLETRITALEAK
jgi:hypothetical protein